MRINFKAEIANHPDRAELVKGCFEVKGFQIFSGLNGLFYTSLHSKSPCSPFLELPDIDVELVDSFTYDDSIVIDWVETGLFRLDDAEAEVRWVKHRDGTEQRISVKAKTFDSLKALYLAIRTGAIKATTPWAKPAEEPVPEETEH